MKAYINFSLMRMNVTLFVLTVNETQLYVGVTEPSMQFFLRTQAHDGYLFETYLPAFLSLKMFLWTLW